MVIETSSDILNIAMAISVSVIAIFIAYFLFKLTRIIQDIRDIGKLAREKLGLLDRLLRAIKEKLDHSATYFGILVSLAEKFMDRQKNRPSEEDVNRKRFKEFDDI